MALDFLNADVVQAPAADEFGIILKQKEIEPVS